MFGTSPRRKVCRSCRKAIHRKAGKCPYCRSGQSSGGGVVVGALVLIALLGTCQALRTTTTGATAQSTSLAGDRAPRPETSSAVATQPGWYYVAAPALNVRLGPSRSAPTTNKEYRQSRIEVLEVRNGWARVSEYYDGAVEGRTGNVARWVSAAHLSATRPADLPQPRLPRDPRIDGIPKVGENGLTEADVLILHRGAKYFLDSGRCRRIEWGDKSFNKPNTYYVNCGGPRNLFFKPTDLPAS